MKSLSQIKLNLVEKFKDKAYFQRFFRGRSQDEIVAAIKELRDMREHLTQGQLAERCGMKTTAVCRLEKPEYGRWNFQTLWRIAEALDARWRFILEPRETVIAAYARRDLISNAKPLLIPATGTKGARDLWQDTRGQSATGSEEVGSAAQILNTEHNKQGSTQQVLV